MPLQVDPVWGSDTRGPVAPVAEVDMAIKRIGARTSPARPPMLREIGARFA